MPTIEQRVVEMRFDNQQFEKGAKESIGTIDKLNKSLDFKEAGDSLKKLSQAGSNFNLKGVEVALSSITEKFSALEIAGITAIQNLTTRGMNMAENFIKSISIDQVTSGWDKYAQKTSAVQTIMSATAKDWNDTGKQMEFVNEQIEKLNWFTDETSYSLLDMTSNIGKFTSNGIKLEDATKQMEGISVWASLSGATIADAGRAMYNLSQAMASGAVKSIDWMSIENANMATREFKEAAIEAAVAQKQLIKTQDGYITAAGKAVDVTNDFKGTLSEKWFTSDVLAATLNRFGEFTEELHSFIDFAGIDTASDAIEMIDKYSEGTLNLDEVAEETGKSVDELKKRLDILSSSEMELGRRSFKAAQEAKTFQEALDSVKEAVASGWMNTFELIFGDYNEAKKVWTRVANELYDVFATAGNNRNELLKEWHVQETGGYKTLMAGFNNIWEGIKNFVSPITNAWNSIFEAIDLEDLTGWTTSFLEWSERFKGFVNPLGDAAEEVEEQAKKVEKASGVLARTQEVLDDLAWSVIRGDYGNGEDRRKALEDLAYSYELVQNRVNEIYGEQGWGDFPFRYEIDWTTESLEEFGENIEEAGEKINTFQTVIQSGVATDLYEFISKSGTTVKTINSGMWGQIEDLGLVSDDLKDAMIESAIAQGTLTKTVDGFVDKEGKAVDVINDFKESLNSGWLSADVFNSGIDIYSQTVEVLDFLDFMQKLSDQTHIFSEKSEESLRQLSTTKTINEKIWQQIEKAGVASDDLKDVMIQSAVALGKLKQTTDGYADSEGHALDIANDFKKTLNSGWLDAEVFSLGVKLYSSTHTAEEYTALIDTLSKKTHIFTVKLDENKLAQERAKKRAENMKSAFESLFEIFKFGLEIVKGFSKVAGFTLFKALSALEPVFYFLVNTVGDTVRLINELLFPTKGIAELFDFLTDVVGKLIDRLEKFGKSLWRSDEVKRLRNSVSNLRIAFIEALGVLGTDIKNYPWAKRLEKILKVLGDAIKWVADKLSKFIDFMLSDDKSINSFMEMFEIDKSVVGKILHVIAPIYGFYNKFLKGPIEEGTEKIKHFWWLLTESGGSHTSGSFKKIEDNGNKVIAVIHKIIEYFKQLKEYLKKGIWEMFFSEGNHTSGSFKELKKVDVVKEKLTAFFDGLKKKFEDNDFMLKFISIVETIAMKLEGLIASLLPFIGNAIEKIKNKVGEAEGFFDKLSAGISATFGVIRDAIVDQFNDPESALHHFVDMIKDFLGTIWDSLTSFDPEKAGGLLKNGGLVGIFTIILNVVKDIVHASGKIAKLPDKITGVLNGVIKDLDASAADKNANALLKIAKAIGIFALAMIGLSFVKPENLEAVIGALIPVMGMVAVILAIVAKMKAASADKEKKTIAEKLMAPVENFLEKMQDMAQKFGKMIGISAVLISLGIAVGLLVKVAKNLAAIPWIEFIQGAIRLGVIGALLIYGVKKLSEVGQNFSLGTGKAILKVATAIKVLARAVTILGKLDLGQAVVGVGALGILMLLLQNFVRSMDGLDVSKIGVSILAISVGLGLLAIPVIAFALLPWKRLVTAVAALGLLMMVFTQMGTTLAQQKGSSDALLKAAAALMLLTIPLVIVGEYAGKAALGLLILAGSMAALLFGAAVAEGLSAGLMVLSNSMIKMGLGAALFSAAIMMISVAIYMVAKTFPVLIEGLVTLGDAILHHGAELATGIGAVLAAVGLAIVASAPALASGIVAIITSLGSALVGAMPIFTSHIFLFIIGILTFAYTVVPDVVNTLLDLLVRILNSIADGLRNHAAPIFNAIANVLDACFDMIVEAIASVASLIPGVGKGWAEDIRKAKDWVVFEAENMGEEVSDAYNDSVDTSGVDDKVKEEIDKIDNTEAMSEKGGSDGESYINSLSKKIGDTFGLGGKDGTGPFGPVIDALGADNIKTKLKEYGISNADALIDSTSDEVSENSGDISDATIGALDESSATVEPEAEANGDEIGYHFDLGILSGVKRGSFHLDEAGHYSGSILNDAARSELGIESPSKVAMQIGRFFDIGLGLGVANNINEIEDGAETASNSLISTMNGVIARVGDILSSDMDMSPTITPVLDLEEFNYGMNEMDRMTTARSFDIAGRIGNVMNPRQQLLDKLNELDTSVMTINGNLATAGDSSLTVEVPLYLDSREVGHATAPVVNADIERMQRNAMRRAGKR